MLAAVNRECFLPHGAAADPDARDADMVAPLPLQVLVVVVLVVVVMRMIIVY